MVDRVFQSRSWSNDLRGLTDDGVRERLRLAGKRERAALAKGMGRNPKAGRWWRERLREAEAELERRGLVP
ncbi:hypothetical protein JCM18899A_46860 [Nocardioides sp. AN3]